MGFLFFGLLACNLSTNKSSLTVPMPFASPTFYPITTKILPTLTAQPIDSQTTDNLFSYRQAMLPRFGNDIDTVATTNLSHYAIDVSINLDLPTDPILSGHERIDYTNCETVPLAEIYFRLYPNLPGYDGHMTVEQVAIDGQTVNPSLEAEGSALRVPLTQPLAPGKSLTFDLTYQAVIPTYVDDGYNIFSYSDGTMALAGFYPAVTVYDSAGWSISIPPPYGDATFLDVALYKVNLTIPESMVVAASGSVLNTVSHANGTKTLSMVSGPMRDFYIAMRKDYQVISQTVDGVVVNSYYPPKLADGGKLALHYAVEGVRLFNQQFGLYPYSELDVVATPTTAGGVEYSGLVVIAQSLYEQSGGFFEHAVAHEVAHQWWYGVVGNNQIEAPWLDESLTNYSALLYWEKIEGATAAAEVRKNYFLDSYSQAKKEGRDRPVAGAVADFSQDDYGTFVYGKGPLFFEALRQDGGDDVFFKIMQTYYRQYKYKIAYPSDLLAVIEQVSGKSAKPLYETWITGVKP